MTAQRPLRRLCLAAPALVVALAASTARAEGQAYELTIDSHLEIKVQNQPKAQEIDVLATLRYDVSDVEGGQQVAVDGLSIRVGTGSHAMVESRLSRDEAFFRQGEHEPTAYARDKAPPELRKILDEFGKPAAVFQRDDRGAETGRKLLVEPTTTLVQHGILDNTRLFHAPFPEAEDRWEAPVRVSLSSGQFATGTLRYEKTGEVSDGLVRVTVQGELQASGKVQGGEIRDGLYKVSGEQFYDPKARQWASGLLKMEVSFKIASTSQPPGSATGTMDVRLKRIEAAGP